MPAIEAGREASPELEDRLADVVAAIWGSARILAARWDRLHDRHRRELVQVIGAGVEQGHRVITSTGPDGALPWLTGHYLTVARAAAWLLGSPASSAATRQSALAEIATASLALGRRMPAYA